MNNILPFYGGPLSQWYLSDFTSNGATFNCAEQYMMNHKALYFGDLFAAQEIMNSTDPQEQKAIGRRVENFDPIE